MDKGLSNSLNFKSYVCIMQQMSWKCLENYASVSQQCFMKFLNNLFYNKLFIKKFNYINLIKILFLPEAWNYNLILKIKLRVLN